MKNYPTPLEYSFPQIINVTDPLAGAQWTQTVPANTIWLINCVEFQLATDATVANRVPRVEIFDGTTSMRVGGSGQVHTASLTRDHILKPGGHGLGPATETSGDLAPRLYLQPGWIIRSSTASLAAGDTHLNIALYIQRWLVNP